MERIMEETKRNLKIREKRMSVGEYEIYVAKDDPDHEPPLNPQKKIAQKIGLDESTKNEIKNNLTQMGFSNVLIQNKVVNDPRCLDIGSAIDIYSEYDNKSK